MVRRIWWPLAVWLLLVVSIVHSSAPFGGPLGTITGTFSDLFYSDPRRLSAVVTMLLAPMAGIALFTITAFVVDRGRKLFDRLTSRQTSAAPWYAVTAAILVAVSRRRRVALLPPPPLSDRREVRPR